MLVEELLNQNSYCTTTDIQLIKLECSHFLRESAGHPLFKSLPDTYNDVHKVKVRMQKRKDQISEAFNQAFKSHFHNIRQRAIYAYASEQPLSESTEQFYVFPINGYKFLYSKQVSNSSADYKQVIDTLFENIDDINNATSLVTDLLHLTYTDQNLVEGLIADSEIIMYGIPYYYAVRTSAISDYTKIFTL